MQCKQTFKFYPRYTRQNRGYSGALIAVGINHRYAYGYPFKSKASCESNPLLEQLIEDARNDNKEIIKAHVPI